MCLVSVVISFYSWKKCLFEKYGAYLPIDKDIETIQINKRKIFMSTKTYRQFKEMFFPLIEELSQDYWCTHTGVDGYMYLLFQRRFLKLTYFMTVISFFAQIVLYFIDKDFEFSLFGDKKL